LRASLAALLNSGGDDGGQQVCRTDRVVVARNRVLDLVRVAVGVQDGDNRDAQLLRLGDSDVLLVGVNDPHCRRDLGHVGDAAQDTLQLLALAVQKEDLLLGAALVAVLGCVHSLQFLHTGQALGGGLEVGEHATEPAVVDVRHANALSLVGNCLRSLLLCADPTDVPAAGGDGLLDELVGLVDVGQGLLQVDDVDAVAVGEDETTHLRVPTAGLVTKVDACIQQFAHSNNSHGVTGAALKRFLRLVALPPLPRFRKFGVLRFSSSAHSTNFHSAYATGRQTPRAAPPVLTRNQRDRRWILLGTRDIYV